MIYDRFGDFAVRYNPPPPPPPPPPPKPDPLPQGDGQFAGQIAGKDPKQGTDLQFAQMANDVYTPIPTDVQGTNVATGTQSGKELEAAGWDRLQPQGDHLVDNQGREIAIDPSELEDPVSGFRAAIYQNDKGQYVVAFAGTNDWGVGEGGDSDDNLGQGAGFQTQEYSQAMALGRRAEAVFGDGNVAFAGQSLGGGLASAATLATDSAGVTFNSSGLSNDTLEDLGFNPNAVRSETADSGQIRRYVVNYEPLNTIQQDVPILNMAPDAVGREFRVDIPDGISPFDLAATHGGGGDGASYVEALRTETPYRPDDMFLDPGALEDKTIQRGAELVFNGFGSILENGSSMVGDITDSVSNKVDDISHVIDTDFAEGDYVEGSFNLAGDVIEGGFNVVGDMGKGTLNAVGDLTADVTNFGGGVLRDLGEFTGLETPFNGVASFVEGTGEVVDTVAEFGGDAVEWVADGLGTVSEGVVDFAGDVTQGVTDVAQATGEAISDGVDAGVNWVKSWF
ncbi:hypothetical protein ACI2IY_14235 [Lysobacter enzymogenes]|uniref:hypothetical protein n=1 Tax=Lysobacter enzymogenes TaxID=69 RepID=UPI00385096A4